MSAKVIELGHVTEEKERKRRASEQARNSAAHERGEMWKFHDYLYDDDNFGSVEDGSIVAVFMPDQFAGIRMSQEDALRVASALIESVLTAQRTAPEN